MSPPTKAKITSPSRKISDEPKLPPCGLYRTGRALKSDPEGVPANRLVMFHNHSNRGIPFVQLPSYNEHNVWHFHEYGPGVEDDDEFIQALEPLREQGFYFLGEDLETFDRVLPKFTLVQLGYTIEGEPIIFPGERSPDENAIYFPEEGYKFEDLEVLGILRPAYPLEPLEPEEVPLSPGDDSQDLLN